MNNTKRVFVHVGPGKTGSSSIQHYMNSHSFINESIMYPRHHEDVNGVSSGHASMVLKFTSSRNTSFDDKAFMSIIEQFDSSNCDALVLSSEYFFNHIDDFERHCKFPTTYICYVRDPVDRAQSGYVQDVKRHGAISRFRIDSSYQLKFVKDIQGYSKKGAWFDIRPFSPDYFSGGTLVNDFLSAIGLANSDRLEEPNVNASYSIDALELKRLVNFFDFPPPLIERLDRVLQRYSDGAAKYTLFDERRQNKVRGALVSQLSKLLDISPSAKMCNFVSDVSKKSTAASFVVPQAESLSKVVHYLQDEDWDLYQSLKGLIESDDQTLLPDDRLWQAFSVEPAIACSPLPSTEALLKPYDKYPRDQVPSILRDTGDVFRSLENPEMAMQFYLCALKRRPDGDLIVDRINQLNRAATAATAVDKLDYSKNPILKFLGMLSKRVRK